MKQRKATSLFSLAIIMTLVLTGVPLTSLGNSLTSLAAPKTKATQTLQNKAGKTQIRPQDDFYEYVNAELIKKKKAQNPSDPWDHSSELSKMATKNLKAIAKDVHANYSKYSADSTERTISDLYNTALDMKTRDKVKLGSLKPYIQSIQSAKNIQQYLKAVATINKELSKSSMFVFVASPDPKDSLKHALFIDEPSTIIKKEDFSGKDVTKDLQQYAYELLKYSGTPDAKAKEASKKLLAMYLEVSNASLSKKIKSDATKTTNYMSLDEIQAKIPNVDIKQYLKDSGQDKFDKFIVVNPKILPLMNKYINNKNLELLKQYTTVGLLNDYSTFLSNDYVKSNAKFMQSRRTPDELAWATVQKLADMELGEIYAKRYFSAEKKKGAEKLVRDILAAYRKNIQTLDWLSQQSKDEAVKKIDTMLVKVGYPETYNSFAKGNTKAPKNGGSLIDNAIAIDKKSAKHELTKATTPVDRNEWGMSPQTLNAYYDPTTNEILFPASMLQAPFYDVKASRAKNLGGIGAIIAHEITHAFDDLGSLYDEKGNMRDWWTPKDRQTFKQKANAYVKHFGSLEALPGLKVDGELTLGENIADTGGVSVITSMLAHDKNALREMYTNYALSWAGTIDKEELENQVKTDEHAPSKIRVNGVLGVTNEFYNAFDVKKGDKMYVAPEKRVKMY